nr:MAG TPA: hypothetical protein [Caudoviricetes sp.]
MRHSRLYTPYMVYRASNITRPIMRNINSLKGPFS